MIRHTLYIRRFTFDYTMRMRMSLSLVNCDVICAMGLLLIFLIFQLTNAQQERAAVYLGRGYDVIKGNPFILRPSDGAASGQLIDPGLKSEMVLNISVTNRTEYANWSGGVQQCVNNLMFIHSISQFHHNILNEMFSNSEDWNEELRKYAVVGDNRTEERKYPNGKFFIYAYEKCNSNERYTSKKITPPDLDDTKSNSEQFTIEGVTDDFRRTVCQLPEEYTRGNEKYGELISSFGTSVIIGTNLGTMKIRRYRVPVTAIKEQLRYGEPLILHDQTTKTDQMYVRITNELLSKIDPKVFEDKTSDETLWVIGNDYYLSPVELSLRNLDEVIHEDYWPNCLIDYYYEPDENQPVDECCSRLSTLRENVKLALNDYPQNLNIQARITKDVGVFYPVVWPSGTYSLFQPIYGCPAETGLHWRRGFIQHVQGDGTTTNAPHGIFTIFLLHHQNVKIPRHMGNPYTVPVLLITQSFCTKVDNGGQRNPGSWPPGSYCVYKYGSCPPGFREGWVYWDDSFVLMNPNRIYGTPPVGVYDENTQVYFCCRNDGEASDPIILPVQKPFILMRIGGTCQTVQWAKVTEAYIYYDGHWGTSWFPLSHFVGGLHPDNDMDNSNNKLYYCYYEYNKTS